MLNLCVLCLGLGMKLRSELYKQYIHFFLLLQNMSDIGRVKKYEVYLAERQKRDLGGDLEN